MPRGDGAGPMGAGPMTGHGAGYCAGYGIGGGGGGRGWRHWYNATGKPRWMRFSNRPAPFVKPAPEGEKALLQEQAEELQAELDSIRKRLSELKPDEGE